MKILFLDFDGVLIPKRSNNRKAEAACVAVLNLITETTGAVIVVSSSWRHAFGLDELKLLLKSWGVTGTIIATTPSVHGREVTRGDEIKAWLKIHLAGIAEFAILDDDVIDHPLASRHIKTDCLTGLTEQHASKAIAMLKSGRRLPENQIAVRETMK